MSVDGNALAVTNTMGAKVGSADVKVDGSTYTITGEATGADMKNPMAGMITKPFDRQGDLQLIGPTPGSGGRASCARRFLSFNCDGCQRPGARPSVDLRRRRDCGEGVAAVPGGQIEELDRDDLLLEVYAQLGEIYLVRTAYDGVEACLARITDCLATYESIRAGTNPELAAQVTMSDADIDHIICRYSRRAQFLRTGLAAAAHGDHEAAEAGLLVLTDDAEAAFPDLAAEHGFLVTYARILCATALCDDDLHVRSVPLWEQVIDAIEGMAGGSEFDDFLLVLGATGYGRFCVETGRLAEAEPWLQRAGARARAAGMEIGNGENAIGAGHGQLGRR